MPYDQRKLGGLSPLLASLLPPTAGRGGGAAAVLLEPSSLARVDSSALAGRVVALYFSASWCAPCARFTPMLREAYAALRARGEGVEVVYVSSDADRPQFEAAFGSMPWLAVDYGRRDLLARLKRELKVASIPCLVLIDAAGGVITPNARAGLERDHPGAANFPWPAEASTALAGARGTTLMRLALAVAVYALLYLFAFRGRAPTAAPSDLPM